MEEAMEFLHDTLTNTSAYKKSVPPSIPVFLKATAMILEVTDVDERKREVSIFIALLMEWEETRLKNEEYLKEKSKTCPQDVSIPLPVSLVQELLWPDVQFVSSIRQSETIAENGLLSASVTPKDILW